MPGGGSHPAPACPGLAVCCVVSQVGAGWGLALAESRSWGLARGRRWLSLLGYVRETNRADLVLPCGGGLLAANLGD